MGIPLLFKLNNMAMIGPLMMTRVRHGLGLKAVGSAEDSVFLHFWLRVYIMLGRNRVVGI